MKASVSAWFLFVIAVTTSSLLCQTTNLFADVDDPLDLTDDDYSKDRIARLIQLLDDKEPQVRGEAAENLSRLGSEARDAIPKMLTLMDDKGRYSVYFIPCVVGETATNSLVTMAPESILPLQQRFTTLSSDAQWKIVSRITNAKLNISSLLPQLIQKLEVTKKDNPSRRLLFLTIAAIDPTGKQAVPLLLKTLREDPDATAREYAAIALSRAESLTQVYWNQLGPAARWFRDSPRDAAAAAESLLAALSDKSPSVRAAAAQSLITYPESGASAVDGLVRLLDDKGLYSVMYSNHFGGEQSVSQSAKMCLIQFDQQADRVLPLIIQFDDWEIEAKQQAIARLVPHCKQPLDQLRIMLDGEHPYLALRAVAVLGPAAKPLIPRLEALTHDKNVANAEEAKSALGFIAPKQFPTYVEKLKQRGKNLRRALSFATDMGPQASFVVPTLLKHLREDDELKMDVARALGSIGPDAIEAAPILIDSLESGYTFDMEEIEGLLVQFGPGVVSLIVPILKNPEKKATLRVACLRVLTRIGPPAQAAIPAIMDELNSKYPRVREAASQALGAIASAEDRSLAALKKAMTDPRPFVRGAAAESCVRFGVKTTPLVPDLIQLISDEYLEVRLASISALGRLGPTAIAAELPIKQQLVDKDLQVRDASKAALLSIRRSK